MIKMKTYVKPSIKTLRVPELLQGFHNESTPEEQLGKSVVGGADDVAADDAVWE